MRILFFMILLIVLVSCEETSNTGSSGGESGIVTRILDGDTIDVDINGTSYRIRYIGVNTPERDEPCYSDASTANTQVVAGKTVRLVKDTSETDRYGRLLRYVYVGDTFVNEKLVRDGWAEAREYPPDTQFADHFEQLESEARQANRGCHPTGIFNN